jgi:Tfp pilus assembly protein PilX
MYYRRLCIHTIQEKIVKKEQNNKNEKEVRNNEIYCKIYVQQYDITNIRERRYSGMRMQKAECRMQNAECRMQNAECRMQNAECRMYNNTMQYLLSSSTDADDAVLLLLSSSSAESSSLSFLVSCSFSYSTFFL